jgi:hypothetical protein
VLRGAGRGVYLGHAGGDRDHRCFLEDDGSAVPTTIPAPCGLANHDHRAPHDQRLHLSAKRRRWAALCDLFRSAGPMSKLALLAEQSEQPGRLERSGAEMSRRQSRQTLQLRGNTRDQEGKEVVAGREVNSPLLERVAEVYAWLDEQIRRSGDLAGTCAACGDCCDFDGFDHRLFITPPELMYLAAHLGPENMEPMPGSRCPYNKDGKCTAYERRFAACRIFCCRADPDFQSTLSEECLEKFKAICIEFQIPYRYTDLATALNSCAGV